MNFNSYGRVGYYKPDYFCGILPNANELKHEFSMGSRRIDKKPVKKDNIESKLNYKLN